MGTINLPAASSSNKYFSGSVTYSVSGSTIYVNSLTLTTDIKKTEPTHLISSTADIRIWVDNAS